MNDGRRDEELENLRLQFVDLNIERARMKRQSGYRRLGYEIAANDCAGRSDRQR